MTNERKTASKGPQATTSDKESPLSCREAALEICVDEPLLGPVPPLSPEDVAVALLAVPVAGRVGTMVPVMVCGSPFAAVYSVE